MPRPGTTARTQAEIERTIITVLLNDDHAIVPVMGALDGPEMFATPEYSRVYAAVLALLRENIVPNVYTVADRAGLALETLQDIARPYNTKASREVLYLCDIVAREYRKRSVQQALAEAQDMLAANPDDLDGYATHVMQMISTASDRKTLRDPAIAAVTERLDVDIAAAQDGMAGYETGLPWLDDKTGGLQKAHVWVLAAPYKGRKTSLARNLILPALRQGAGVDWFALEGSQTASAAALQAMLATDRLRQWGQMTEAGLSETYVMRGMRTPVQQEALAEARRELNGFNLRIYDGRDRISSAERIATLVKRDQLVADMRIFVVDFLQRLGTGKLFDRMEAATNVLQTLIQESGVTGILITQLNESAIWTMRDDGDESYSPGVKGGGDVPAAADYLITTRYRSDAPEMLGVNLKLARFAQPGKCNYGINPSSGLILQQLGQGD